MKTITVLFLALIGFVVPAAAAESENAETPLRQQLKDFAAASDDKLTPAMKATMTASLEKLRNASLAEKAVKTGDRLPAFTLPEARGGIVSSKELLKKGPLVVVFYRGGWCPYCNLQLRDLQKYLPEITAMGATLVAISPQTPDKSLSTAETSGLRFPVLSDVGNKAAGKFGLVFEFSHDLKQLYQDFGIDLEAVNGDPEWRLPMAATYVVNRKGKVTWSFVDADYKKRPDTADIIAAVRDAK